MNVFEDLVIELKEENLLEDTVIDEFNRAESAAAEITADDHLGPFGSDAALIDSETQIAALKVLYPDALALGNDAEPDADLQLMGSDETVEIRRPASELEFFKKRATGEVSSLQMVEHVLTAVEREQLKALPRSYDDLEVKKALHMFMQVADDISNDAHKEAEFKLMQEVESWCSALAIRDRDIPVASLRRYCETCRPMLSSQAMLAMARFYRNLPYSEVVRGKFDYIITRLFSRAIDEQRRKLLFKTEEMLGHIKTLYADWSSIPLYAADTDSKVNLAAISFAELTVEAESAERFDDLIRSDFFGRLRLFKESIAEMFYAPVVTVAAIECNIRIGNVYVDLIDRERRTAGAAMIHDKYGFLDDETVSEAAGRSFGLTRVLSDLSAQPEVHAEEAQTIEYDSAPVAEVDVDRPAVTFDDAKPKKRRGISGASLGINTWLLSGAILVVLASVGVWVWGNYFVGQDQATTAGVKKAEIEGAPFREHLKISKVSGDNFYAVLQPSWETMPKEKREELVKAVLQFGQQGGWSTVNLSNAQGKTVAFASATRLDLYDDPK